MSNFYVDRLYKVWQRARFLGEHKEEVIRLLSEGKEDEIFDEKLGFVDNKILYETEEVCSPNENEGLATIELYEGGNFKPTYSNEKKRHK